MPVNVKDKLVTLEALKLVNDINLPKDLSELDSVPNEVTVSSTDIIAMQVDGTTYKLPVSALASALKSTGNYITSSEVANDLTTSTAGKVLDARQGAAIKTLIDSLDLSDVSEAHENTSWKSAPIGMSHYYYDEVDASTTYGVPVDNCFVVVMRSDGSGSQSRGVALALRWTRGSTATTSSNDIWMSTLQDEDSSTDVDWFAWTQISHDILPVSKGGTGSTTAAGIRNTLGLGNTTGALPIANGGTGQTTEAGIRNTLGLGNTTGALPIANGGTGAIDADNALTNLGAAYGKWGTQISSFAAIPGRTGMFSVVYVNSSDADAPITTSDTWWWNVIQFGAGSRVTQIAYSVFRNRDVIWFRQKHDSTWYGWYKMADDTPTNVAGSTGISLSSTEGSISQYSAIKTGGMMCVAFVFTASVAKSAGQSYTIDAAFANAALRPALRTYAGGSNQTAVKSVGIAPDTTTHAYIYAALSTSLSSGAVFWVSVSYPCADL